MTRQVPTRFADHELAVLDELVQSGVADSRSEAIRLAVAQLAAAQRRRSVGQSIAEAYRERPQTREEDELALANALAMTAAEPW